MVNDQDAAEAARIAIVNGMALLADEPFGEIVVRLEKQNGNYSRIELSPTSSKRIPGSEKKRLTG